MSKAPQRVSDVSKELWVIAEKAFLKREEERRADDTAWRRAAAKMLGAKAFAMGERGSAGGLWNGEGHTNARKSHGFDCSMDQEDRTVLERFQATVGGIGTISPLKKRVSKAGKLQFIYTWRLTNQRDLEKLWAVIGPYLGAAKRKQFAKALSVPIATVLRNEKPVPDGIQSAEVAGRKRP